MFKKYYKHIIIGFCVFFLWIYLQGTIDRILFQELVPIKIPEEFYQINSWLEDQKDNFKIIWLPPQFGARILDWASDRQINDFVTPSSVKPTLATTMPYSRLYYLFFETAINTVPRLDKFFDILNAKYLIFRKDLPEDYGESLLNSLKNNPDLEEINLEAINSKLFCQKSALTKKNSGEIQKKEYFAICEEDRESYLQIFENKNYAPLIWIPESLNLVIGGMEAIDILNSQTNFDPVNQELFFANQELDILDKIKDLKFQNIIFNNTNFEDLVFAFTKDKYLIAPASLTNEGEGEWRKASTEEPLHGEWHRVIDGLKISNWDFDFGKSLIYSETPNEKINIPLRIDEDGDYLFILRYFQNNKGGRFKIILRQQEKTIKTLNLNNKFTTEKNLLSFKKGDYFLNIENLEGFNTVNLIALVPVKEYQQYEMEANAILEKNRTLYIQKISPEMTIEPLEFNLPRENNYEVSLRLKGNQGAANEIQEEEESMAEGEKSNINEKIIDLAALEKEIPEDINLLSFGNLKYHLTPNLTQKISWQNLGEIFLGQKEKILIYQKTKPTSILTVDNFFILDQGNLELDKKNVEDLESPIALKVSNLIPQIEILQGSQVSERRGRLISDAIKVQEYQNFYLEYKFQGENLKGIDSRILFYGEDYDPIYQRTAFKVEDLMNDQIGNVEQKKISHFFGTPENTYYIKVEFKAEPNSAEESWFEISDFKLFEEESLSGIDALMLSEDKEETEESEIKPIISYEKINPTQYKISFSAVEKPFVFAFAESYDPMWKLKEKKEEGYFQKRFGSLFSKNNDLFPHFPLYTVINGFYIDPQKLETNELILEYEPQNWFEAGLWISADSLAISFFTFIIYGVYKKRKEKRDKLCLI
ncbi:hypothetical protein COT68_02460 [bacterium (Candidatus Torokbacteria) CG09_land_8_20_14_0_10_42_11]|nr:MAG: hypothetical protein COT68_02460 [bacterium (Candidatus Torokbacteria) CG09_land_8_20_14_0_10_42_11]